MTARPGESVLDVVPAYDDAGSGEPPVVLLHGWGFGHPSHLTPLFDHLSSHRRVLKLDLPGHGRSALPPPGFGFANCAAAIAAQLDAAGIDRAVICGHSLGARLAIEIAGAHPSRTAGVVLLDPVVLFPEPVRTQALSGLVPALRTDDWLPALQAYFSRLLGPNDPPSLASRLLSELAEVSPEMAANVMHEGMQTDGSEALARVDCPTLVVSARAPMDVARLRAIQPDAWVGSVVGSGHWLTLAAADQVNAMVDRFLAVLDSAA